MLTDDELVGLSKQKRYSLVSIGVRIPRVFHAEGKKIGKKEGYSFSHFVRRAMAREFLSRKEKS